MDAGQAQIDQFGPPLARNEDVGGFDVPVDDISAGGMPEGLGDLERIMHCLRHRERSPPFDHRPEIRSMDIFVHNERNAPLLTDIIHPGNVLMIELGSGFGFIVESLTGFRFGRMFCGEHFEGDDPIQPGVPRPIDPSHAAAPDQLEDFEMFEPIARQKPLPPAR